MEVRKDEGEVEDVETNRFLSLDVGGVGVEGHANTRDPLHHVELEDEVRGKLRDGPVAEPELRCERERERGWSVVHGRGGP